MAYRAYVGNLPFAFTKADLEELFKEYGQVTAAQIVLDRETGRSRGFAFVELDSNDALQAAIRGLDGAPVGGRSLTVSEAREREARSAAPRPGGFRPGPQRGAPGEVRAPRGAPDAIPDIPPPRGGGEGASHGNGRAKGGERDLDRADRGGRRHRGMDDYDRHDKRWLRSGDDW